MAIINGTAGNDNLNDTAADDSISGGAGNDTITVTGGPDEVDGGADFDTLVVQYGSDTGGVSNGGFAGYEGFITTNNYNVRSVRFNGIERFVITTGSGSDNLLTGAADDIVSLGSNDDFVSLGLGNNIADGGANIDGFSANFSGQTAGVSINLQNAVSSGAFGSYSNFEYFGTIAGSAHNDVFVGTNLQYSENLVLGLGDDSATVLNGADAVEGGAGTDTLIVDYSADSGGIYNQGFSGYEGGFGSNNSNVRSVRFSEIERFIVTTGSGYDNITTGAGNDIVNLGSGDDFANLGLGNNIADGGANIDGFSANFSAQSAGVSINLQNAVSSGAFGSYSNFEYFGTVVGSAQNDVLVGTNVQYNEVFSLGGGDDSATVLNGADAVEGGAGTDTLVVNYSADTGGIYDQGFAGYDRGFGSNNSNVRSVRFTEIEKFNVTTGSGSDSITTGAGDDILSLGGGDDFVNLVSGNDQADGGANIDGFSADYSGRATGMSVNLQTGTSTGNGITNFEYFGTITGTAYNDVFVSTGQVRSEVLNLGLGDDAATVVNGVDAIDGGLGVDTLTVDYSTDTGGIGNQGFAGYEAGFSSNNANVRSVRFSGIERFVVTTGTGSDNITTGAGNDTVVLGSGDDFVDLGAGINTADGGANIDRFSANFSALASPVTIDLRNPVNIGAFGSYSNFEYFGTVTGTALDDVLIGTAAARGEVINLGNGDDIAGVNGGADAVEGGAGMDTLIIDYSSDTGGVGNQGFAGYEGGFSTNNSNFRSVRFSAIERFIITTGTGADNITTAGGDDEIRTGAGDDTVNAAEGDDFVEGGAGNDVLNGGLGYDTLSYAFAASAVTVSLAQAGPQNTLGAGTDTLSNFENIQGSIYNDSLTGNDRDNVIDGGLGADAMAGGRGSDTYLVDDAGENIIEFAGQGIDRVETGLASYTLGDNFENLLGSGVDQTLTGNALNNGVVGTAGGDSLAGLAGDDVLAGMGGMDTLNGGEGDDILISSVVDPTNLIVNGSFETQNGTNDARDYVLNGPGGVEAGDYNGVRYRTAETLLGWQQTGGRGFELNTYGATAYGNPNYERGEGDSTIDMEAGLAENLALTQIIQGIPAGTQLLLSFTAAEPTGGSYSADPTAVLEVYWNGALIDTVTSTEKVQTQHAYLVTASGTGTDRLEFREVGGGNDAQGTSLDAITLNAIVPGIDTAGDALNGGTGDDTLIGDAGKDMLDGGAGRDRMQGGAGDDTYLVDEAASIVMGPNGLETVPGDIVDEAPGAGTDEIRTALSAFSLALIANVENLTGTRIDGGQALEGNSLTNIIRGTAFADTITGSLGNDQLIGGAGDDVYIYNAAANTIVEDAGGGTDTVRTSFLSYTVGANLENLEGLNTEGQSLTGNSLANRITGNSGNDTLDGGAGADTLIGGLGNDIYIVDDFGDTVTEAGGQGTDTVRTAIGSRTDFTKLYHLPDNVENMVGTSATGQGVYGNALDNVVTTGAGGDLIVLDGGGNDTANSGGGADFIYFGGAFTAADVVNGGAGTDTVGLLGSYDLTLTASSLAGVERLALYTGSDGPANNYTITAIDANVAAGANLFVTAASLQADETFIFNGIAETNGTFTVRAGAGDDIIAGGAGADYLDGAAGADKLYGLNGRDTLFGDAGADLLRGGNGGDYFLYRQASDSTVAAFDHIEDFQHNNDKIDLSAIDAIAGTAANDQFTFIGAGPFTEVAGQLRAYQENGLWIVAGDTNGDGNADLYITVTTFSQPVTASDFFL